jgi:Ca2+-binding EF-hand superfamily protein
MDTNNDE